MQNFLETNRHDPEKIDPTLRLQNFDEIYQLINQKHIRKQAERCVQCGDPFCTTIGCPLQNHIPQWLEAIASRDLERAFKLTNESSPFPEILGRICPQSHLCEGACTLNDGYGAITIGSIEATITDLGFAAGLQLPFPGIKHPHKVAIIGSGPAGMSCANFLLRAGIGVEMYERAERPGGLLTYGIPGFKLGKEIVAKRFEILEDAGLRLHLEQEIGATIQLDEIISQHDAVFIGVGATSGRQAGIFGESHPEVISAMSYLTEKQHQLFSKNRPEKFPTKDKRVVVIGGGDTAMDCLRTAARDDANHVLCLYRRDEANMPGSAKEFSNAIEETVEFEFNVTPCGIHRNEDGVLCIEVEKTRLGATGTDGRQQVEIVPDSKYCIVADMIILALGFDISTMPGLTEAGINTSKWGQIEIDPTTGVTTNPKVYSGGDCHRGADLVVTAAADGRKAALAIMEQLLQPQGG